MMTVVQSVAIALVVIKPGSKDQQTVLMIDEKVRSI